MFNSVADSPIKEIFMSHNRGREVCSAVCTLVAGSVLLFLAGCANQKKAVELYVDAVMLNEVGQNDKAVEKLDSAVRLNRRFSLAYSLLGDIYQQTKNYEKSAVSYEKATELNPWSFKDYFDLGKVYQIMEKSTQAVKAYAKACELKPDHLEAHLNAARGYYQIKDYNNAMVYYQRVNQIDPNISEPQKTLGDIYESQKKHDQAIASYKRALEIDSNNLSIMISLAVVYLRSGNNESAKELLASVIQLQPDNSQAYQYMGYCCLRLREQAVEAYKKSAETDSNNPEIKASFAKYLDESIENYNKAIEINSKNWEAFRGLGVAYILQSLDEKDESLKEKAIKQWQLSLDIKPDQPRRQKLLELIQKYSKKVNS